MLSQLSGTRAPMPYCFDYLPSNVPIFSNTTISSRNSEQGKVAWLWGIFFCFIAPEFIVFLRSLWNFLSRAETEEETDESSRAKKLKTKLNTMDVMIVAFFEVAHSAGTALLFTIAFPEMDSVRGALATNALCWFPGFLLMMKLAKENTETWKKILKTGLTLVSLLLQITALAWPVIWGLDNGSDKRVWALPVGAFLTSLGWWEGFVGEWVTGYLSQLKTKLMDHEQNADVNLGVAPMKMCTFFLIFMFAPELDAPGDLFRQFINSFDSFDYILTPDLLDVSSANPIYYHVTTVFEGVDILWKGPLLIIFIQMISSFIAYLFGKFACQGKIQEVCYALPLSLLATPICVISLLQLCYNRQSDACIYSSFPPNVFFHCPEEAYAWDWRWIGLLWFVSQLWITHHIWFPKNEALEKTDSIFGADLYSGLLIDQSLMLNRRNDEEKKILKEKRNIRIKGCATLWHETSEEMEVMLQSTFRMDDWSRDMNPNHKDYFHWELHVFFDDAMTTNSNGKVIVNSFVETLMKTVENYGEKYYGDTWQLKLTKFQTPYGGRLVWQLPGGTSIVVHLKNKKKIRHKKRWSQIMYIYYFLVYMLNNTGLTEDQKEDQKKNTFLLALGNHTLFEVF